MAVRRRAAWAGLRGGAWLGWMVESNWTDPVLFAGYSLLKPLAQSLILAVIYLVVQRRADTPYFAAMMVGQAFYLAVGQILAGVSWCVVEDREFYGTIRYICLADRSLAWYLLGRCLPKAALGLFSTAVVLAFARGALGAPLRVEPAWITPALGALLLGLAATAAMGLGLAGVLLLASRQGEFYSEAVTGAMFLLVGAVFPVEVLPEPLQAAAGILPQTYWLEAMRRALCPSGTAWSPSLAALGPAELMARLVAASVAWGALGAAAFRLGERRVRHSGTLDVKTES